MVKHSIKQSGLRDGQEKWNECSEARYIFGLREEGHIASEAAKQKN